MNKDTVEDFAWWNGAFSSDELDEIVRLGNQSVLQKATTANSNGDSKWRDSSVCFFFPCESTNWIFQRLADVVVEINNKFFGFDIQDFASGLQFTKYCEPNGHYGWHTDRGKSVAVRKLSLTLQLSAPEDYDGGNLEMNFGGDVCTARRDKGMMTIFPSYALHRVTPVTRGTRYSLVAWVSGPPFK